MDCLVIDLTHGGVKIAISLKKKNIFNNIYCYDIYNTLNDIDSRILEVFNIKIVKLEDLKNLNELTVVYPIHLPLTKKEIKKKLNIKNITFLTHHEAVKIILESWSKRHPEIPKVEITGVKGKTSSVFMLKEILDEPLILSSLGAIISKTNKDMILKKNISITPANIKETIDLSYKINNPVCEIAAGKCEKSYNINYKSAIFENSLGGCGIGDVGLLTNIVENYPIAKGNSNAQIAKKQIFKCSIVVCERETLEKYYSNYKATTFSLFEDANITISNLKIDLMKTTFTVNYHDLLTCENNYIKGSFEIETFAPSHYHVKNVLGVIGVSLSLNIDEKQIQNGLKNYKGIPGRSSIKKINNSTIIEEINPGINVTAIKKSIDMIKNLDNYVVVIGGDYGVTCEEINEVELANLLNTLNIDLFLTGDVGLSLSKKINKPFEFIEDYSKLIDENKNILFIYRSNYKNISKR